MTSLPELYGSCPGQVQETVLCYDTSRCYGKIHHEMMHI